MRLRGALALLLLLCIHGGYQGADAGGDGFVRVHGTRFALNGSPFFANGFNAYWLMSFGANPAQRGKVTSAMSQAAGAGLSVARTWAFSDGGGSNALQYSPGRYNEDTFQGLDFVLSEARKHGIKMILSLVNSYDSFGGRKQYVQWAREQGQSIGSDDEFFTNPVVKGFYKNHIKFQHASDKTLLVFLHGGPKTVLTRVNTITGVAYKDDPTIMAWELMNEPRCQSDLSGRTLQSWITEMAAHVKSIDGAHLLEAGLEGFYGASTPSRGAVNPSGYQVGTDFIANNRAPGIDFATVHSYPDQWLPGLDAPSQLRFLGGWLDAHIADAQAVLRKPLLVAEFGKSRRDPGYNGDQRDEVFGTVYAKVYESARAGGPAAGALFWQLLAEGMDSYGDGYEVVLGQAPSTTGVITTQSRRLQGLARAFVRAQQGKTGKGAKGGN
ncbi:Mannan endo-1,4-beta-mannosidase 1 [Dichanthelium oligosanthes]|uniref:mannan endo-1,4-beta-mannosidase n=1 Tax=Dichanthelium oligosanthes TaxID=888268 RepID=A0A1E5VS12_9POAL|nr:Mannan endo-1,4-beta-mannosidase 1 [Dichanthelium oligosanthes]